MSPTNIKRLIRGDIQDLHAYRVADAAGMIKLDAMENPYPLPEELRQGWAAALTGLEVNRYPDPRAPEVKERLLASRDAGAELGQPSPQKLGQLLPPAGEQA